MILRRLKKFAREDRGSATVEFALWFPLHFALLLASVDIGLALYQMGEAWDVARDFTRKVAVGELTVLEAEVALLGALQEGRVASVLFDVTADRDVTLALRITPDIGLQSLFDLTIGALEIDYTMRGEMPVIGDAADGGLAI